MRPLSLGLALETPDPLARELPPIKGVEEEEDEVEGVSTIWMHTLQVKKQKEGVKII